MTWEARHHALMLVWRWFAIDFDEYRRKRSGISSVLQSARETHCGLLSRREVEEYCRVRPNNLIEFPAAFEIKPPNPRGDTVSVLKLRWYREAGREHCLVNYGSWSLMTLPSSVQRVDDPNKRQIPIFTGFRFETPEMGSNHAYHHSQPSRSLGDSQAPPVNEALDLTARNPTWPMAARDTVQLALCVILALYGFDGFDNFRAYADVNARSTTRETLNHAISAVSAFQLIG